MSRILRLRNGSSLDLVGLVVLGTLVVAIVFLALIIAPLVSLYRKPPSVSTAQRDSAAALAKFRSSVDQQVAIVDNRSWFFDPKPPDAPEKTARHTTYGGPSLIAYIDSTAWFSDGTKLSEKEPKSSASLKLVHANPPWGVTVEWAGGTYDVDLIKKTTLASLRDSLTSSSTYSYPATSTPGRLGSHNPADRAGSPADARSGPGALPAGQTPAPAEPASAAAAVPAPASPSQGEPPPPPPPSGGEPPSPPPPQPAEPNAAAPSPGAAPANPATPSPSPAPADSSKERASSPSQTPSHQTTRPSHS